MKVRECYTERKVNPETGEVTFESGERWIETQDIEDHEARVAKAHNADIQAQLAADAAASFDDFLSGDKDKIAAIKKRRNELRAQLK